MIKFEEHEGKLFRMLEEPVPLTDDTELPVLVRMIQDDTMLGKRNKRSCHPDALAQKIICIELTDDGLFMDGNYTYRYEIIGYPVADGSAEWRNYQLVQGKCVYHPGDSEYYQASGQGRIIGKIIENNEFNSTWNSDTFMRDDSDGWQIYEPKPLLADIGIGDIVKTNLGDWLQIVDTPCLRFGHDECHRTHDGLYWDECGVCDIDSTYRIVAVEPLATEGTKEWALQMMNLRKCVCHVKAPSIKYHRPTYYVKRVVRENCTDDMYDTVWMEGADPTGWQIYKEPKPQYKVGNWVEIESSHAKGKTFVSVIKEIPNQGHYTVRVNCSFGGYTVYGVMERQIIRKLKPSEVVVKIGCLSGTVEPVSINGTHIWFHLIGVDDKTIATIRISSLDTPTRELVESLLEAQGEGDKPCES